MTRWLRSIQAPEGWFPGGLWRRGVAGAPSVFNTGQILFGLTAVAGRTGDAEAAAAADRAAAWLVREQDSDGRWRRWSYRPGWSPDYYAHVCWPLAEHAVRTGRDDVRRAAVRGLEAILAGRAADGTFPAWGFAPGRPAFTHTIAYTLQGIVESAALLDAWDTLGAPAVDSLGRLLRRVEVRGGMAGAYGPAWEPVGWYRCLTGHCQIASAWLTVNAHDGDPRWLNGALKLVGEVAATQRLRHRDPGVRGAIAGSAPVFGRYMAFRYPNWAAKFFLDAGMALERAVAALRPAPALDAAPCPA
jgi:hypothetical protein